MVRLFYRTALADDYPVIPLMVFQVIVILAVAQSNITLFGKKQLADSGLSLNKDGTISADKEVIINADNKDALSHIYESLNSFKNSIKEKAEDIALNPMDYVNNKIIAYKNPLRSFPDPYNLSAYTGMMFNGYI